MSRHLDHATAFGLSKELVGVVAPCLRGEEQKECAQIYYGILMKALAEHNERHRRELQRLAGTNSDSAPQEGVSKTET